jgi:hypothetical protein
VKKPSSMLSRMATASRLAFALASSTRCRMYWTSPPADNTGALTVFQNFSSKPPPAAGGRGTSYRCVAMESVTRVTITRSNDARRLSGPLAYSAAGFSGKTVKKGCPRMERSVRVACR